MSERKFAVTRVIGNDEVVLKLFGEDEKSAAIAYGAEIAKHNTSGVIACVQGVFDIERRKMSASSRVFEVWSGEKTPQT
ncbi:MAG: hypothetical protein ACI4FO_02890 [Acutalibacteraceae bacterium]